MNRKLNQKGFSPLFVAVGLVALLVLGGVGYYIWHKDGSKTNTDRTTTVSKTEEKSKPKAEEKKMFALLDGKVTFEDDGTWKAEDGGYFSEVNNRCGQGVTSDLLCLDHQMLILSSEKFTNPDQYQVNVSIFERNELSAKDWSKHDGNVVLSDPIEVNGLSGHVSIADYSNTSTGEKDIRSSYVFVWENYLIVISSNFFNKSNGSYTSTKDYTVYQPKVESLAKSITVNN